MVESASCAVPSASRCNVSCTSIASVRTLLPAAGSVPRIAADAAGAAARRAALAALWANEVMHRAISAACRLEVVVRLSSLLPAVSASLEGEDHSLSDYESPCFPHHNSLIS